MIPEVVLLINFPINSNNNFWLRCICAQTFLEKECHMMFLREFFII